MREGFFGNIDQAEVRGKRADHLLQLLGRHRFDQFDQAFAQCGVIVLMQLGKPATQRFDRVKNPLPRLLAQHVAQQGAEQPHLRAQMIVSQQVERGIHGFQGLNKAVYFLIKSGQAWMGLAHAVVLVNP